MEGPIEGFRPSPQQSRIWRLQKDGPGSYASLCLLRIEGDLDRPALRRALAEIVARHEILRTAFRLPAGLGVPLQVILEPGPVSLPEVDFRRLCPERQSAGAADLLSALGGPPFDHERGEGWRAALVRLGPREHGMLLALSAACADPGTFEPLAADLLAAYARQVDGRGEDPEPPLQYADVAEWQNSLLEAEDTAEAVESWRQHWRRQGIDSQLALPLPLEEREAAPGPFAPQAAAVPLARETAAALERLAGVWGCPLTVLVLTAWKAVIQRGTGRDETLAGVLYAGRDAEELRSVVGPLARYLPVTARLDPAAPLREAVDQVREAVAEAERRGEYFSWDHVAGNGAGGFPVCFEALAEGWELAVDGLRVAPVQPAWNSALLDRFSLALSCRGSGEDLRLALRYDPRRFRREAAHHLAARLSALLRSIAARPEASLADHPAMAEEELSRWLEMSVAPPAADRGREGKTLHAVFAEQADRTPDRLAVAAGDGRLTFRELDVRANRLAHHLRAAGAGPEVPVALCLERSAEAVVALLATWKAGAAYVPLDPTQPAERLAYILGDTGAPLLVTDSRLAAGLPGAGHLPGVRTVRLDEEAAAIARRPVDRPAGEAGTRNLAYTIYTSGSTGWPKGVQIEHRSALHLLAALEAAVLDPLAESGLRSDPLLASLNAPMIFDASVQQLVLLLAGHALCVVPEDVRADGAALLAFLREQGVELLDCTPSQLRLLVDAGLLDGPVGPRIVLTAGEAVDEPLWKRLAEAERTVSFNLYGPTECSVDATFHRIEPGSTRPTIGRPLAGYEVFLLDRTQQPVPPGAPGELCLGGPGLARGYLRRPDLTAERFMPHPFAQRPGERLYRTGDLGRHRPDGGVEFLGRLDHQVKVRGFRIELGEIEAALVALPGVREAVVLAREDRSEEGPADPRLVAYVVGDAAAGSGAESALRQALRERLPDYMVPAAFVMLPTLPLTPNGKVDRKALPAPERQRIGEGYLAPRTPVEEVLAGIWAELLGLERVGAADNFFDLGGHSLVAARVMTHLRGAFDVEMSLRALFESPTLADLAARVEETLRAGAGRLAPPLAPLAPALREGPLPLSFAQQRLWFVDQLEPGTPLYNIPLALRIEGPLDSEVLALCLGETVRRHEALRTVFATAEGSPVQVVQPAAPFALAVVDLAGLPESRREALALTLASEEARRPFDLARGPLLRGVLLRLAQGDHVAALTLHHIAGDGWSTGILIREVTALYAAFAEGMPSPLPELPVQYADFAAWQRSWLHGEILEREISFWRRQLAGLPPRLELPTDRPRPAVQSFRGAVRPVRLPAELTRQAQAVSRRAGATLFMVLLAGFQALLARWSGQQDLAVGTPVAGRDQVEIEGLIGFFVNTLVLRGQLTGDGRAEPSFRDLLVRVRETALAAHTHQDVPFEKLVQELSPERSLAQTPLFQVMFALQNAPAETLTIRNLRLRPLGSAATTAKFDLLLALVERNGALDGAVEYATDLFDAATIDRLIGHFERLLAAVVAGPERPLAEIPLLSEDERRQILGEWGGVPVPEAADAVIHELFAAVAARAPRSVALVCGDEKLTYAELDARADRLAGALRGLGVGPEVLVGLCAERSIGLIVGLLAILKAGGAYLPLDPESPEERLRLLLEDAGVTVLLAGRSVAGRLPQLAAQVDLDGEPPTVPPGLPPAPRVDPDHLAYVMYTSGSTGRPKGVSVRHRGVARLCREGGFADFDAREVFLQAAPVSFDASTLEIWACLLNGGRLVLPPPGALSLEQIGQTVREQGVTTLWLTAGLFHLMVDERLQDLAGVRQLLAGGDVLSVPHVERMLAAWPECRLINGYGPTENTTFTCCHPIEKGTLGATGSIPIGRPIHATRVYIVDPQLAPVPAGVAGELLTGGAGLARGYLGRPDLTAERFIPDPHGGEPGERLYRTGDLCRFLADGTVEFLGRIDQQVKIRGFRIEPGEVEAALRQHPHVREAAVVAAPDGGGQKRLVAYVVAAEGAAPEPAELRRFLSGKLPDSMVPSVYMPLEHLPVTPNGKVDRRALEQREASAASTAAYREPRDPVERELARIWEELLGVERVGLDDDFFQLGGHSLLAVGLISRIERQLGQKLPLAALFQGPTIGQLARIVRETSQVPGRSPLIPLQPEGDAPPWYFIHPVDGQVHAYVDLARSLGEGIPAYGLQAPGLKDIRRILDDLPAIAEAYASILREAQPQGPYFLAGWSGGGTLAFELARTLRAQGRQVGALVLIDTLQYADPELAKDELALWVYMAEVVGEVAGVQIDRDAWREALLPLGHDARRSHVAADLERRGLLPAGLSAESFERMLGVYFATLKALRSYEPQPHAGPGVLVRATGTVAESHAASSRDASYGWAPLFAEGLEIHDLPGTHQSILAKEHVGGLASLFARLRASEGESR